MEKQFTFSLRKTAIGVISVAVGAFLVVNTQTVSAQEAPSDTPTETIQETLDTSESETPLVPEVNQEPSGLTGETDPLDQAQVELAGQEEAAGLSSEEEVRQAAPESGSPEDQASPVDQGDAQSSVPTPVDGQGTPTDDQEGFSTTQEPAGQTASEDIVEPVLQSTAENQLTSDHVAINEVQTRGTDWVEIVNRSESTVDISGWYIVDDNGVEARQGEFTPVAEGTLINPGGLYTFIEDQDFFFGLGSDDEAILVDAYDRIIDRFSWQNHAGDTDQVSWSRNPETGEFEPADATFHQANTTELTEPDPRELLEEGAGDVEAEPIDLRTDFDWDDNLRPATFEMGESLVVPVPAGAEPSALTPYEYLLDKGWISAENPVLINEINSNPDDFVEIINVSDQEFDISGYEIRDDNDNNRWRFPLGSVIPARGLIAAGDYTQGWIYDSDNDDWVAGIGRGEGELGFGIGGNDQIRLFTPTGELLDIISWGEHAHVGGDRGLSTLGRYPDAFGNFNRTLPSEGFPNEKHEFPVAINEVQTRGIDWVEIFNHGDYWVDISGWYIADDNGVADRMDQVVPVAAGTRLNPGETYIFTEDVDFFFGLGSDDAVLLVDNAHRVIDSFTWTSHAGESDQYSWSRVPDGLGEFQAVPITPDAQNITTAVILSEVNTLENWVELYNPSDQVEQLDGYVLRNQEGLETSLSGEIGPGAFRVIDDLNFTLDANDALAFADGEVIIGSVSWEEHPENSLGLHPDSGRELVPTSRSTRGAVNAFADIPDYLPWPGPEEVRVVDSDESIFESDMSGLDFAHGHLYAVDNGTGLVWILALDEETHELTVLPGWENGKRVRFQHNQGNPQAAGPDAEGITVDAAGLIYVASERDNDASGVNWNVIIQADPSQEDEYGDLVTLNQWDITELIPQVTANRGIEAVQWVPNSELALYVDENTGNIFDPANYPNAVAGGVFFVALEDNGHVYGFVLNEDGSAVRLSDMDSQMGAAMALDYDYEERTLWVVADDDDGETNNRLTRLTFNGTPNPDLVQFQAPESLTGFQDDNHEGFAIADPEYTNAQGLRPAFWIYDGEDIEVLRQGYMANNLDELDHVPGLVEIPAEEVPAEEVPGDDEGLVEEGPVEEVPGDEVPVAEPDEETPDDEISVEEVPVAEPGEELPSEEVQDDRGKVPGEEPAADLKDDQDDQKPEGDLDADQDQVVKESAVKSAEGTGKDRKVKAITQQAPVKVNGQAKGVAPVQVSAEDPIAKAGEAQAQASEAPAEAEIEDQDSTSQARVDETAERLPDTATTGGLIGAIGLAATIAGGAVSSVSKKKEK